MQESEYEYYDPDFPELSYRKIPDGPVVLDFTGCKYLGEMHHILKERFGLPAYYGENWAALWDLLDRFSREPLQVKIRGLSTLPKDFEEDIALMLKVLNRVHKTTPNITIHVEP